MNRTLIVIFGATGDLAKRKLIPALYRLVLEKKADLCAFLFIAREDTTIEAIFTHAHPFIRLDTHDNGALARFMERSFYMQRDITKTDTYAAMRTCIEDLETRWNTCNRLFYCAVSSQFFCVLTEELTRTEILQKKKSTPSSWHRIVYEKPFGHDLASAHAINACIAQTLYEDQVFRIDHYLTKEIVSNIALIRFTNCIFEPLWNNRFIDHVQIILSESVSVGNRGAYYDMYGALRDVVQNHMLQLLSLIAMESPTKLTGEPIRNRRAEVLKHVSCADGILGQYETYAEDVGNLLSRTETFAALKLYIQNPRWSGVPFYLKTGKYLGKKETVIHIKFKSVDCLLTKQCPPDANWLSIRVAPDATFSLTLNAKSPTDAETLIPIAMEFCHSCLFSLSSSQEYEFLLQEIMRGEQAVSVRFDEIEHAWQLIDTIYDHHLPLYTYVEGSDGPAELEQFSSKNGMQWHS
jgi:glucose-6-phosphate 1-dehydrogenase